MRLRAYARCLLLVALVATGWAQPSQQASETQGFGSVVGHVYCADTNAPARFARVTIEPIEDFVHGVDIRPLAGRIPSTTLAETRADGSFSIENVIPGTYYILAELAGYLSPLAEFTSEEIMEPTDLGEKRIRAALQQVTVVRNQASRMDFRIERGAAISGRALYDDGGPSQMRQLMFYVKRKMAAGSHFRMLH